MPAAATSRRTSALLIGAAILAAANVVQRDRRDRNACRTNGGAKIGFKCAFPFILSNGKTYTMCTTDNAPPGSTPWCSVETRPNRDHILGQWGECNEQCPMEATEGSCITDDGRKIGEPCAFPFIFQSVVYRSCTAASAPAGSRPWCSVRTTPDRKHIKGQWGECGEACPGAAPTATPTGWSAWMWSTWSGCSETCGRGLQTRSGRRTRGNSAIHANGGADACRADDETKTQARMCSGPVCCDESDSSARCWKPGRSDCAVPDYGSRWSSKQSSAARIVNGDRAGKGEFAYMAALGYYRRRGDKRTSFHSFQCGGSLINRHFVMTAAHCGSPDLVVLGAWNITDAVTCAENNIYRERPCPSSLGGMLQHFKISPDDVIVHPRHIEGRTIYGNDLELIRLKAPGAKLYSDNPLGQYLVTPTCIPWKPSDPGYHIDGERQLIVTGWGRTTSRVTYAHIEKLKAIQAGAQILQKLFVTFVEKDECLEIFRPLISSIEPKWKDDKICAGGEKGKDSCNGDSGGPLVLKTRGAYYQVGVISFGTQNCGIGVPGVHTEISRFTDFVNECLFK